MTYRPMKKEDSFKRQVSQGNQKVISSYHKRACHWTVTIKRSWKSVNLAPLLVDDYLGDYLLLFIIIQNWGLGPITQNIFISLIG